MTAICPSLLCSQSPAPVGKGYEKQAKEILPFSS